MLYKANEIQWVSLKTIESITLRVSSSTGRYYLDLYTGSNSVYSEYFYKREDAEMEVSKIEQLIEENVRWK